MKEKYMLSPRQVIFLIVLFLFGSSAVVGVNINTDVGQDSWISLLLSFILNIPFVLILARIVSLHPGKNIFEIFDELLGKIIGKIFTIFFLLQTLLLGSIVLRNFSEYVEITTLTETPQIPIMICLLLIVIYLAKSGFKALGRWAPIVIVLLILTVVFTIVLSIPVIELENMKPILNHSLKQMTISSVGVFLVPFSELFLILGFADRFNIKKKEKKTFLLGIFATLILLMTIILRNIMVLGIPLLKNTFFSSYQAARNLELGEFITRIEGLITINFVLAGLTKITILVLVLAKGLAHISKNYDYKRLIVPSSLLILAICPFLFDNVLDIFDFAPLFAIYSIPVQVIIPIIVWIVAEIKNIKKH